MPRLRVAVIGAGSAGLAICQCLENESQIDYVVYERANWVGGTWRYTKNDKNEINTPMYKNLRTNLPKELMAYPDFPFPNHLPSFIPTDEVGKYLEDYAEYFDLMKSIKLEHEVVSVKPTYDADGKQEVWKIVIKNLRDNTIHTNVFDAVVVCSGHFEMPRLPEVSGLNTFPGKVIHSIDYDKPENYKDQVVAILGAKSSGADISMDLSKFAKKIYLIYLGEKTCTKYPDNIEEITGTITAFSSNGCVEISNGESRYADVVIFCTGYLYSFPFLDPECGINVSNNYVTSLYKHIFNIEHPSMSFIGICLKVCPFPNYALQAKFVCSVLTGRQTLPSKDEMLCDEEAECQKRIKAGMNRNMMHSLGVDYQLQYCEDIADLAGVPCTYTHVIHSLYSHVNAIRAPYLATYKKKNFEIDGDEWKEV